MPIHLAADVQQSRVVEAVNLCVKDLARTMGLSVHSVKRWLRKLASKPTIEGHSCHRWSESDAAKFIAKWRRHCRNNKPKYETNHSKTALARSR